MQRCVYNLNDMRGLSPKQMCTKIAIASPTPTTISQRFRVVRLVDSQRTWDLTKNTRNGYYSAYSIPPNNWNIFQLRFFLYIAKEWYKLTDYKALELLRFFKFNITQACRHLVCDDGYRSNMQVEVDTPWRIVSHSISELPSTEQFTNLKIFETTQKRFITNVNRMTIVLPKIPMIQKYEGCYLRIQRTFHTGRLIWVCCLLPNKRASFEIVALLMPSSELHESNGCTDVMEAVEQYFERLVVSSKSWSSQDQIPQYRNAFIQLLSNGNYPIKSQ